MSSPHLPRTPVEVCVLCIAIVVLALSATGLKPSQDKEESEKEAEQTKVMSFEEYAKLSHAVPYVLTLTNGGHLLYFGARHTYDPTDPQIEEIQALWEKFCPTVAFVEGTDTRPLREEHLLWRSKSREQVMRGGEPSWVRFLAARDGVPARSLEPPRAEEAAFLLKEFPADQVKLFYILRDVPQRRARMTEEELDKYVQQALLYWTSIPGVEPPHSLGELEKLVHQTFPELANWRDVPQEWFDPVQWNPNLPRRFTNEISAKSSEFRDQHMVALLIREVKQGERVFAVVGASHVVMQEPALRAELK
jgi:hypothetical protein